MINAANDNDHPGVLLLTVLAPPEAPSMRHYEHADQPLANAAKYKKGASPFVDKIQRAIELAMAVFIILIFL